MPVYTVEDLNQRFADIDGDPLEAGYLYIGQAGLNPEIEANRITVYWDRAMTIPAAQPIRTVGGSPFRNGKAASLYVGVSEYAVVKRNKNGSLISSDLNFRSPPNIEPVTHDAEVGLSQISTLDLTSFDCVRFYFRDNVFDNGGATLRKVTNVNWSSSSAGFGAIYFEDSKGNKFERIWEGPVNPCWWGVSAAGDECTTEMQRFLDWVYEQSGFTSSSTEYGGLVTAELPEGDFLLKTCVIHSPFILRGQGWKTRLIPHDDIPEGGAVLVSLSGSATSSGDESTNVAALAAIYGAGNEPDRRAAYDLRGMVIEDLMFFSSTPVHKRAIWFTGFTAGASINRIKTYNLIYGTTGVNQNNGVITLNGSWVWSMNDCDIYGSVAIRNEGFGVSLAVNGQGTHIGSTVCNNFTLKKNRFRYFAWGSFARRGLNMRFVENDWEACSNAGLHVFAGSQVTVEGNYIEANGRDGAGDGARFGGESDDNSDSYIQDLRLVGNYFDQSSNARSNCLIRNVKCARIADNRFRGSNTIHYQFLAGSQYMDACWIEADSAANMNGAGSINPARNTIIYREDRTIRLPAITASELTSSQTNSNRISITGGPVTISADSIQWHSSNRTLIPFSGSSDDLATITDGVDGAIIIIGPESAGYTITVRHNSGTNGIMTTTGADVVLDSIYKKMMLQYMASVSRWIQIGGAT